MRSTLDMTSGEPLLRESPVACAFDDPSSSVSSDPCIYPLVRGEINAVMENAATLQGDMEGNHKVKNPGQRSENSFTVCGLTFSGK
jgi:hypothetical protein